MGGGSLRGIYAGSRHACVLDAAGSPWCWGDNAEGQAGPRPEGLATTAHVPKQVEIAAPLVRLSLGPRHSCGLTEGGEAYCWGDPDLVGHREGEDPAPVEDLPPVVALSVGMNHTCALTEESEVWCWGRNDEGQLGIGEQSATERAQPVETMARFVSVTADEYFTCAMTAEGDAYCWGRPDGYPRAAEAGYDAPTYLDTLDPEGRLVFIGNTWCLGYGEDRLLRLDCGGRLRNSDYLAQDFYEIGLHLRGGPCVIEPSARQVICPIDNGRGQAGLPMDQVVDNAGAKAPVLGLPGGQRQVAVGDDFACSLSDDDQVSCWGENLRGQLGLDDWPAPRDEADAIPVDGGHAFTQLAAGEVHACGLTEGGEVWCWGLNSSGQSGQFRPDGTPAPEPRARPAQVSLPRPATALTAVNDVTCATLTDGHAWCWGAVALNARRAPYDVFGEPVQAIAGYYTGRYDWQLLAVRDGALWRSSSEGPWRSVDWPAPISRLVWSDRGWLCAEDEQRQLWCGDPVLGDAARYGEPGQFDRVAASGAHACGLQPDDRPFCWGENYAGQLGDGTRADRDLSAPVLEAPAFAGLHLWQSYSFGQTAEGVVYRWGGLPVSGEDSTRPRISDLLSTVDITTVTYGRGFSCAVRWSDRAPICWGEASEYGQLGDGSNAWRGLANPVDLAR